MSDLNQFQYDTILIAGWRKDWKFKDVKKECESRGIDIEQINKRAFNDGYLSNIPVRAAVAQTCSELSKNLWSCKKDSDFVLIRNLLNRGKYNFKGRTSMISKEDNRQHKINQCKVLSSITTMVYEIEGSKKIGGSGRSKRWGGSN